MAFFKTVFLVFSLVLLGAEALGSSNNTALTLPSFHNNGTSTSQSRSSPDPSNYWLSKLSKKLSPYMSILSLWNEKCWSATYDQGTCYPMNQCLNKGGSVVGNCAGGFGVCCLFLYSCGTRTERNDTYFSNREFPEVTHEGWDTCSHSITKLEGVCQVRLDFEIFEMGQPDPHGNCASDSLSIHGGDIHIPLLCGELSGHHVYIPVGYHPEIELFVTLGSSSDFVWRRWKIKVTKIKCTAVTMAPGGCLQYHTGLEGAATSMNYFHDRDTNLNGLNYGVCVRRETGYCAIEWTKCEEYKKRRRRRSVAHFGLRGHQKVPKGSNLESVSSMALACHFLWVEEDSSAQNVTMNQLIKCIRLMGILGRGMYDLAQTAPSTTTTTTPTYPPQPQQNWYQQFMERKDSFEDGADLKLEVAKAPWYLDKFNNKVKDRIPEHQPKPPKLPPVQSKPARPDLTFFDPKLPAIKDKPSFGGHFEPKLPTVQEKPGSGGYFKPPKLPAIQDKPTAGSGGYFKPPKLPAIQDKPTAGSSGYFKPPKLPIVQTKPEPGESFFNKQKLPGLKARPKPGFGLFDPKPPKRQPKPKPPKLKLPKPPKRQPKPKPPKLKKPKNETKCAKKKLPIPIPIPLLPVIAIPFPIGGGGGGGGGGHGGWGEDESGEGWGRGHSVVSSVEPYLVRVATDSKREKGLSGFCMTWRQIACDEWYGGGGGEHHFEDAEHEWPEWD